MQSIIQLETVESEQTDSDLLDEILAGAHIIPVYQAIVSLIDGKTYGYEALSRISDAKLQMDIDKMFRTADSVGKSWELETLCRTKALENSIQLDNDKKLFLNVNSNIIHDDEFIEGFTRKRLNKYGLDAENIIFEVTERVSVLDNKAFLASIKHYKSQNYRIAIDDVGAGYSGLNIIASVKPDIMKLDMSLIRNIDKDETKQLLCKAMVDFGKTADIKTIAEGIETEEELKALVKLGIDYGQGYFLALPQESFADIPAEKTELIKKYHVKSYNENVIGSVWPVIGYLAKPGNKFAPEETAGAIYEKVRQNHTITEFSVIDGDIAVGFMTRTALSEIFGGKYGYSLHANKPICKLMKKDFLRVNFNMPSNQVSQFAMQRPYEQLYDPIVVEKDNKYFGIVTVKDLLDACAKAEVNLALQSNPLTGLPGNLLIEHEILKSIFGTAPYCITYYDIDNFKAYNDAYGFDNGDRMLTLVADILKKSAHNSEFIGHIGGDDFIVIGNYHAGDAYCSEVLKKFAKEVTTLYREEDVKNGYIVSKNRSGVTENFPIASLSIAGISNKTKTYQNISDFSEDIAQLKKKCKRQPGNYFEII